MNLQDTIDTIGRFVNTAIISPNKTYFGDMSDICFGALETEVPGEFGLYQEITNLQRLLSLFEEPSIQLDGPRLLIEGEDSKATFLTSDLGLIKKAGFNIPDQLEKTLASPKVLTVIFDETLVQRVQKAVNTIDNSKLIIDVDGDKVYLVIKDTDVLSSDSNSMTLDVTLKASEIDKDFTIEVNPQVVTRMPKGGFKMQIGYSSRMDEYRLILQQDQLTIVAPTSGVAL